MTNSKGADGKYHIKGKVFELLEGSRAQVWHETAFRTSGGLEKKDLFQTGRGRIVSRAKHQSAKKEQRLVKYGYGATKGKFGAVKLTGRKSRKTKKTKGGVTMVL